MADRFDQLLDGVENENLRQELAKAYRKATGGAPYGIHFNPNHLEDIRLFGAAIVVGSTVVYRNSRWKKAKETAKGIFKSTPVSEQKYLVKEISGKNAIVEPVGRKAEPVEVEIPVSDLVVLKVPGEPIFPILNPIGSITRAPEKRSHVVIEGENYSALQLLQFTHRGQVDTIYIDPPYNTGNKDWTYNDSYVSEDDGYRHSKWLSFMERRLRLAKSLLKETGVILISIDDNEYAQLKLLCDRNSLFGEGNFIASIIWGGKSRKNNANLIGVTHEYVLVYAKNIGALTYSGAGWTERKEGVDEALKKATELFKHNNGDCDAATNDYQEWLKSKNFSEGINRYKNIDEHVETRGPVKLDVDISAPSLSGGNRFEVLHPVTRQPMSTPKRGYRFKESDFWKRAEEGNIHFGKDHNRQPSGKTYLNDYSTETPNSVVNKGGQGATKQLEGILGERGRFPFPKDADVLARFIDLVTPDDGVVLDFFGGSGTTMQSVAAVNEVSNKTRQCILITANELQEKKEKELSNQDFAVGDPKWDEWGLFYQVTKPRIKAIFTGKREDGSELPKGLVHKSVDGNLTRPMAKGLDQNVEFFTIGYTDLDSLDRSTTSRFQQVLPTLWLMSGAHGSHAVSDEQKFFVGEASFAVLFKKSAITSFAGALKEAPQVSTVFIVTDDINKYEQAVRSLPNSVPPRRVFRLYSDYINTFAVNTEKE